MHKATTILLTTILVLLATTTAAWAAAPSTMAATGILRSGSGGPVADGAYDAEIGLWDAEKAGNKLWFEAVTLGVKGGSFSIVLGKNKPLDKALTAATAEVFLSVQIGKDPELSRTPLHGVAYAYRAAAADKMACSGCIGANELAAASVTSQHTTFSWAAATVKGGPATQALDLKCTGCVSVAEMSFDADVDLKGHSLTAGKIITGDLKAQSVAATSFVGDGSKLTNLPTASGSCPKAGDVVKGIKPDGSLICTPALSADGLPGDALDDVSNGLLSNQYVEVIGTNTALAIKDNNPVGVSSELAVPDLGITQQIAVNLELQNSDISKLKVILYAPDSKSYALHDGGGSGKLLAGTWPTPKQLISGDLTEWHGKNTKGTWRLQVIDGAASGSATDGELKRWSLTLHTMSSKKVTSHGKFIAKGGFQYPVAAGAPGPCTAEETGTTYFDTTTKALTICNGLQWDTLYIVSPGTAANPAIDCADLRTKAPYVQSGPYWLDIDGPTGADKPFEAWCDMTIDGGGWTLALNLDTSDGHVMWWANPLWTNKNVYGTAAKPFASDHKNQAYNVLRKGNILLVVHKQGQVVGWKKFIKTAEKSLQEFMTGGDNTLIGGSVDKSDVGGIWANERLVRTSTKLYANHCVTSGGTCVGGAGGSPDGDRIGSHEGTPKDNDGGGLGNWHDMAYCCTGQSYAGKNCNGSAFRTTSEAQAGWAYTSQHGTFGTDSFGKITATQNDSGCGNANWAKGSGVDYDFAIYIGGK